MGLNGNVDKHAPTSKSGNARTREQTPSEAEKYFAAFLTPCSCYKGQSLSITPAAVKLPVLVPMRGDRWFAPRLNPTKDPSGSFFVYAMFTQSRDSREVAPS